MRLLKFTYIFMLLGAFAPGSLFAQGKNRIAIQTGLLHCFFDKTPVINFQPNNYKRIGSTYKTLFRNLFGGVLLDSKGLQYERTLNSQSTISCEIMTFATDYPYTETDNPLSKPVLIAKNNKLINITYSKKYNISNKIKFVCGGGVNYLWGNEMLYWYQHFAGWGWESRMLGYYRHDFGLNIRSGIEYTPSKWLTLYSNINFLGIVYLNAKDTDGNDAHDYYKEKFGVSYLPSRYDLAWRFGIGFNFGK